MASIREFFAFARERHSIYLRRKASLPAPWTTDEILRQYSFTNVFRQLDKTTQWYTNNVVTTVDVSEILLATVVYRWFNRIKTGEAIFQNHGLLLSGGSAWDKLGHYNDQEWNESALRKAIIEHCGDGPYVTGAYIIKTPDGYSKLDGVLRCIEWFMTQEHPFRNNTLQRSDIGWQELSEYLAKYPGEFTLESLWDWLRKFPYLGDFMAYEIVTDLRWTILHKAPDIMTWANPGPGATRGIGRVFNGNKDSYNQHTHKNSVLIPAMKILLDASKNVEYWPQFHGPDGYFHSKDWGIEFSGTGDWPSWELRDVEHTLCEFDKYERTRTGEGRPRGRFHGGTK